jgi:hypothetical protein
MTLLTAIKQPEISEAAVLAGVLGSCTGQHAAGLLSDVPAQIPGVKTRLSVWRTLGTSND